MLILGDACGGWQVGSATVSTILQLFVGVARWEHFVGNAVGANFNNACKDLVPTDEAK